MKKYRAVIFDLYDTLVTIDPQEYLDVKKRMAAALGVNSDVFIKAWKSYTKPAARGEVRTVEDRVARVATDLGVQIDETAIAELATWERFLQEQRVIKLAGCEETLLSLSRAGLRIALATNTSSVSKPLLEILGIDRWFNAILFSFEHNMLKPELAIYQKASEMVGVAPPECIFVGDGNDRELDGAMDAGMLAIKIGTLRDTRLSSKQSTRYHYQVDGLIELPPLIQRLNSPKLDQA